MSPRSLVSAASVYVHIPFCARKCAYCDFFSVSGADAGLMEDTLDGEIRELDHLLEVHEPRRLPSLYLGGGTPSALPRPLLARFLRRLLGRLPSPPGEFTLEANPESLDESFLDLAEEAGAGRLSLGIQTFHRERLRRLGRAARPEDNAAALKTLARSWRGELNLDLIYGFPGQTGEEALDDLERLLEAGPGHLSLYALTVEEGTPLHRRVREGREPDVDEDRQEEIRDLLHERLLLRGYQDYEVSNYARPGRECRHNLRYWRLESYMGIGPGGVSTLPGKDGRPVRLSKRQDIGGYIARPLDFLVETLSPLDFLVDYLLMGLRTRRGVDGRAFRRIFGAAPEDLFPRSLARNSSLLVPSDRDLTLTDPGRRLLNQVVLDIMEELDRGRGLREPVWPDRENGKP